MESRNPIGVDRRRRSLGPSFLLWVMVLTAVWTVPSPVWAAPGTLVVDAGGGGDFTTVQAAVNAAAAGDTIQINSGTYAENVDLSLGPGSLTLVGNDTGGGLPVISGNGTGAGAAIRNSGAISGELIFRHLVLHAPSVTSNDDDGILLRNVSGTIRIEGCTFTNIDDEGIHIENNQAAVSTLVVIHGNQIVDGGGSVLRDGVLLVTASSATMDASVSANTITTGQNPIELDANDTSTLAVFLSGNTITATSTPNAVNPVAQGSAVFNLAIVDNTISSVGGDGINLAVNDTSVSRVTIVDNIFPAVGSDGSDDAIFIRSASGDSPTFYGLIANNTLGTTGTVAGAGIGLEGNNATGTFNLVIGDNSLARTNSSATTGGALEILAEGSTVNVDLRGNQVNASVGSATGFVLDASTGTINLEDAPPTGNSGPNTALAEIQDNNGYSGSGSAAVVIGNVLFSSGGNAVDDTQIPRRLGDFVWDDQNRNGIQDGGEPGVSGVLVSLSGTTSGSAFTGADGHYEFAVLPGGYTLTVHPPAGWALTQANVGNDGTDSDFSTATGQAAATVVAGQDNLTVDAGLITVSDPTISKSAVPAAAASGDAITYTLHFTNTGAGPAIGTQITDNVPAAIIISGVSSSTFGGAVLNTVSGGPNFVWSVDNLVAGAGGTITVTGTVNDAQPVGTIVNTANIAAQNDTTPGNNSGSASIQVPYQLKACGLAPGDTHVLGATDPATVQMGVVGNLHCVAVQDVSGNHPNATTGLQTGRFWRIQGEDIGGAPVSGGFAITLTLPTAFVPDGNSKVCRYTGTGQVWDCAASAFDGVGRTVTRQNVSQFSDWAAGSSVGPTAITLRSLTATSGPNWGVLALGLILGCGGIFVWLRRRSLRAGPGTDR